MTVHLEERQSSAAPVGGRERILQVARAAFVERGYAAVSMQEIADEAKLTKAAIYYHFRDKQELLEAVVIAEMNRLIHGVLEQLAPGPPLRAQLERITAYALEADRGDRTRLVSDARRFCGDDRVQTLRQQIATPYGLLRDAFAAAQARGEIGPGNLDLMLTLFINMIEGQVKGSGFGPPIELPPHDLARALVGILMDGIATPSPAAHPEVSS